MVLAVLALLDPGPLSAQGDGTTESALAGGLLGGYSGATLGVLGAIIPCAKTHWPVDCFRISTLTSGAIGATSGGLLGAGDASRLGHAARNTLIGTGVGVVAGLVLTQTTQRVGVRDVLAMAFVAGGIGAVPRGAAFGSLVGGLVAGILWPTVGLSFPDALSIVAIATAVGGLSQWLYDGIDARATSTTPVISLKFAL